MNRYLEGAAALGCRRLNTVVGNSGDKVPTGVWVIFAMAISGMAVAAVYNTVKG